MEAKTDYKARLEMLKSGRPRIVIRKTNRYVIVQVITTNIAQDSIVFGTSSKILLTKGWPSEQAGSLKGLCAAYLTGFFIGKQVKGKIKDAIIDMGMHRNIQKSRIYAVVKGLVDAGLSVAYSEEVLPTEKDLERNKTISEIVLKVKKAL